MMFIIASKSLALPSRDDIEGCVSQLAWHIIRSSLDELRRLVELGTTVGVYHCERSQYEGLKIGTARSLTIVQAWAPALVSL